MQRSVFEDPLFFLSKEQYSHRKRRYVLGLFFIFMVSIIWTLASMCSQYLYMEHEFDSPFLMTYIGVALFAFILPIKMASDSLGWTADTTCLSVTYDEDSTKDGENDNVTVDTGVTSTSISKQFDLNHPGPHWNHSKHIFVALHIAPVLFIANWLFNASLQATSIASSTVLVSTSSLFVMVLAVLVKEETFNILKLLGVMLGISGTVLTALHDFSVQGEYDIDNADYECTTSKCEYSLWGDTLAVLAAVAFGAYAVQVRLLCPADEELYSMALLLGYIGVFIALPLFPLALFVLTQVHMDFTILGLILLRGFLDYVVSEYLHFRAVVLTNATIATVGLGLTIPMAFLADWTSGKANIASVSSLLGAILVSAGFLLVNLVDDHPEDVKESQSTEIGSDYILDQGKVVDTSKRSPASKGKHKSQVVI